MKSILMKCIVLSLALVLMTGVAGGLTVLGTTNDSILLEEDFDTAPSNIGDSLFEYNGWFLKMQSAGTNENSDYTIGKDPDNEENKVASLYKPNNNDEAKKNGLMVKQLSRSVDEGFISVRFRARAENENSTVLHIRLVDTDVAKHNLQFQVTFNNSRIGDAKAGGVYHYFSSGTSYKEWFEFEILIDMYDKKATYFENGIKLNETPSPLHPDFGDGAKIDEIWVGTPRNMIDGAQFYVDDIVIADVTDYDAIIDDVHGQNTEIFSQMLTESVTLPTNLSGAQISWESSNTAVVGNDGTITRPIGEEYGHATLTATITISDRIVVKTYEARVLPTGKVGEELLLAENFDVIYSEEGDSILGYNGWGYKMHNSSVSTDYTNEFSIKSDPDNDNNNLARLFRNAQTYGVKGEPGYNDSEIQGTRLNYMVKSLARDVGDGTLSIRFKTMWKHHGSYPDQGPHFRIHLCKEGSATDSMHFQINTNTASIGDARTSGGAYYRFEPTGGIPLDNWYDFEILIDKGNNTVTYFENGRALNDKPYNLPEAFGNIDVHEIWFGVFREATSPAELYFDDITVTSIGDEAVVGYAEAMLEDAFPQPVSSNITLTDNLYMADVSWESDNTAIIANDGTINRPVGDDVVVNLTATITKNSEIKTVVIPVTVLGADAYEITSIVTTEDRIESVSIIKRVVPANSAKLFVAVYSSSNKLEGIKVYDVGAEIGAETMAVDMEIASGQTCKAFMWNMSSLRPLTNSYPN